MFFNLNFHKCSPVFINFLTVIQSNLMHYVTVCQSLLLIHSKTLSKKQTKLSKNKPIFWLLIRCSFVYVSQWSINYARYFCEMNNPVEIYNRGKCHLCSLCGCKFISTFCVPNQHLFWAHFGGVFFFVFFTSNIVQFWWHF